MFVFFRKHKTTVALLLVALLFLSAFSCDRLALFYRKHKILPYVRASAEEFDVPLAMVLAVIRTESNFFPDAVSEVGARGLMQLMPQTFAFLCEEKLEEKHAPDAIDDPCVNVRLGTYYLSYLYGRFKSWPNALAAYNAGEGRVEEWLKDPSREGLLNKENIPFPETSAYVQKTLAYYEQYLKKYTYKGEKI